MDRQFVFEIPVKYTIFNEPGVEQDYAITCRGRKQAYVVKETFTSSVEIPPHMSTQWAG